jgi:glycine amidinotransferase/scyllo-inosamine-4-phosphate amidinotransferase 1
MLIFQQLTQIKTSNYAKISMCMTAINEWSPLKKVIVGIADRAKHPELHISHRLINHNDKLDTSNIPTGSFDQSIIEETNEDLNVLVKVLEQEGVEVVRPKITDCEYYNYCPRDTVFHHGNITIACPVALKARKHEWKAFGHHLQNVIELTCSHNESMYNTDCIGPNPNVLAVNETEPVFDAANCIKANNHILYLVSNTANMAGCNLLQEILGSDVKVHPLHDVYSFAHIDSTITFLREGLMMINPIRVTDPHTLPEPFNKWDIIKCPDPVIPNVGPYQFCSPWVYNMNLISINERLVVLEEHQTELRKLLSIAGIESIGVPGRHMTTLGGGPHCTTLDLDRS